ncbi:MAG TPA: hypothetical protein DCS21_02800 [Gammaproteobacteria bacterium]|nr:hypothetical protein [Gammaproteobacteria bacterium]
MIDPIVEEVRSFRAEHARQFNFDLQAICADIRQFEASCGHKIVEFPLKKLMNRQDVKVAKGKKG